MSFTSERVTRIVVPLSLALLMAATRFHHFGSSVSLPDASLAVFFLAGVFLSWRWFPAFVLLAGLIDYVAVTWAGVSDWCITPAYAFLVPTYAVMTLGGGWARRYAALRAADLPPMFMLAALSATAAFAVSNGSFYLYSGYFAGLSVSSYFAGTARYFLPYISAALVYIVLCLAGVRLARLGAGRAAPHAPRR